MRYRVFGLAAVTAVLSICCAPSNSDIAVRFERYMAASNGHDLVMLEEMTHDDIVWVFGPFTFVGKDQALRPHGTDLSMYGSLEVSDIVIRGDTVECTVFERNDATRAHGPDSIVHYPRYVFRDGLVWRKESHRPSSNMSEFQARSAPFRAWLLEAHPDAAAQLAEGEGWERFGVERGREYSRLLGLWIEAGRPGT